ncbi:flagellar hook protein [Photobacterium gaetbulicola]|uniref:Flagellar hook-associated protein 2 n=1 Tax=Photobacterium gaetbulicola Gung47 TaxID=658445 RepID=A0A0C5WX04_9GAMM|nr:flagellar filament capping protein FliD [Photobacterium gaetbulicola]AJR09564.1 putative flagellar hook-associated protein 2 [Photobacterium gaetbulicola Gung47]PSU14357.1 flagellar hook protein [Photobacterium gaetbulicola]
MGLSVGGLGSGLDVAGMTDMLVAAERTPKQQRIDKQMQEVEVSLSAYGQVNSSMSEMQDMFEEFDEEEVFLSKKAVSSENDYLKVSAESHAQNGNYSIEINQLAQSHRLVSANGLDADPSASLGDGELVFSLGSESMTVTIDPAKSSLKDVVDAINNANGNPGINATTITIGDQAHIVFTSDKTGAANTITIDASNANGDLATLGFDPADPTANPDMDQMQEALDAEILIDNFLTATSDTNEFDNVIDGVKLNVEKLTGTIGGGRDDIDIKKVDITISNDTAKAKGAVESFTESYNGFLEMVEEMSKYDVEEKTGGPLVGDSITRSFIGQMRTLMNSPVDVNGEKFYLSDFGVTTTREGVLEIDDDMLDDALDENFAAFNQFFASENGFLKEVDKLMDSYVGREGTLTNREESLEGQKRRLEDDQRELDRRMEAYEERTYKQMSAMDAAIYKMNNELNTMMSLLVF